MRGWSKQSRPTIILWLHLWTPPVWRKTPMRPAAAKTGSSAFCCQKYPSILMSNCSTKPQYKKCYAAKYFLFHHKWDFGQAVMFLAKCKSSFKELCPPNWIFYNHLFTLTSSQYMIFFLQMNKFQVSSFKFQVSSFICHIHDYTETV